MSQFAFLSDEERLLWLQNLSFLITPDLRRFTDLLSSGQEHHLSDPQQDVLLEAPSGMGKTLYLEWLASSALPKGREWRYKMPVVFVVAPVGQSPKRLLQRMLLACGRRYQERDSEAILLKQVSNWCQMYGVVIIIIDEITHLQTPAVLRCLGNIMQNRIPVIGASCDRNLWRGANEESIGQWSIFRLEPYTGERLQQLLSLINLILPFPEDSFVDLRLHKQSAQAFTMALPMSQEGYFIQETTRGVLREMMRLIFTASEEAIKQRLPGLSFDILHRTWQQLHHQPGGLILS